MNVSFLICLVLCIGFGMEALRRHRLDRADEYHLMHGPTSDCPECVGK